MFKKSDDKGPHYYDPKIGQYGAIMKDQSYHELYALMDREPKVVYYCGGSSSKEINRRVIALLNEYWDEHL